MPNKVLSFISDDCYLLSYKDLFICGAIVKVTVWADLANKLNEELEKMTDEDNIIILTSCGITKYRSMDNNLNTPISPLIQNIYIYSK